MPEFGQVAELGALGLALLAVIMLIDFIRNRLGNVGKAPSVIECPYNARGVEKMFEKMVLNLDASTTMLGELLHIVEENRVNIREVGHTARLHGPGSRSEKVREESRDLLHEILVVLKRNGFSRKG
jgi:hypothetical protein